MSSPRALTHPSQISTRNRLVFCLVASALGYALNVLAFPMFFGVDFLFGSIATTIAAISLGWRWGGVVAALASLYTVQLWGHPYAAIVFTIEAVWLGWSWQRGRQNIISRDLVFWCAIGMPLVLVFYRYSLSLSWKTAVLIALKQSANGLLCCAIVSFLMLQTPLGKWIRKFLGLPPRTRDLQQIAFNFLVPAIFLPLFGLTVADSRIAIEQLDRNWQQDLHTTMAQVVQLVDTWNRVEVRVPGNLELQLALYPFEVPPYVTVSGEDLSVWLDLGANFPRQDTLVSQPQGLQRAIQHARAATGDDATGSDRGNRAQPVEARGYAGGEGDILHYVPKKSLPVLAMYRQSYYAIQHEPTVRVPFAIEVFLPAATQIDQLETFYIRNLSALLGTMLMVAAAIEYLARRLASPLKTLAQVTTDIPKQLTDDRELHWPQASLEEVDRLSQNFQLVAQVLQAKFQELEDANEALELRVSERTAELEDTMRELKATQAQLIQSEKMSGLGQLVAGVAHEINNPVSFIHGNLSFAEEYATLLCEALKHYETRYPEERNAPELEDLDLEFVASDFSALLRSMRQGTQRIQNIVSSLRSFSRLDESEQKTVNPIDGIEDSLELLHHRLIATPSHPAVQVIKSYEAIPPITCFPGQLNQAFLHLLGNAIDALENIPPPHVIKISAAVCQLAPGECGVEVKISDNGCGIPPELQERIFEPFFTTKPVGSGTGMGLAVCHSAIVATHGGQLEVESRPTGTTFTVRFPCQARVRVRSAVAR